MICLTGDVHHMSLKSKDQRYLSGTEAEASIPYLSIAREFGVKVTLFITGKTALSEPEIIKKILREDHCEVGGHTFSAFSPRMFYKLSNRLLGLKNGPEFIQNRDIKKTLEIFRNRFDCPIVSWRDHAYRHDRNTPFLLEKNGIRFFSDLASPDYLNPFVKGRLVCVPINVLPDHDYIYHGDLQPGQFDEGPLLRSVFKTGAMDGNAWLTLVKSQVEQIIDRGGVPTILAHPACMEIIDNFKLFSRLCRFLSRFESIYVKNMESFVC